MAGYTNADIMKALLDMKGDISTIHATLESVEEQTKKTNGRVNKLDAWMLKTNAVDEYKEKNPRPTQNITAETVVVAGPKWYDNQKFWGAISIIGVGFATILSYVLGGKQ